MRRSRASISISCRNLLIYLQPPAQQKVLSLFHFALNRGGVLFLGPSESPAPLARRLRDASTSTGGSTASTATRACRSITRLQPRAHGPARAGAPPLQPPARALLAVAAARRPTTRCSTSSCRRACWSTSAASSSTRSAARAGSCSCATAGRASTCSSMRRRRAEAWCSSAGCKRALDGAVADRLQGRARRGATARRRLQRDGAPRREPHGARRRTCSSRSSRSSERAPRRRAAERRRSTSTRSRASSSARSRPSSATPRRTCRRRSRSSRPATRSCRRRTRSSGLERGAAEHERGAAVRQRGALHGQRRVPAEDRASSPSSTTTWTTCSRAPTSARSSSTSSSGSASSRRRSPRASACAARRRAARSRRSRTRSSTRSSIDDLEARARDAASRSSASCAIGTARRSSCASCRTARRATVDGVVLTLIDVSGLKAAEDALFHERYLLNSLLVSVPDAIYFKDARGRFIRANHAMAERLGLADPREAVGQDARSSCPTASGAGAAPAGRGGAADRRGAALQAREARAADGSEEWDLVTRLPLRDATSSIVGVIGDLPRRHRAEARRGEDPGGGAPARRVPRDALARAAQPARRRSSPRRRCSRSDGAERRATASSCSTSSSASRSRWRACSTICSRRAASPRTRSSCASACVDLRAVVRDAADAVREPDGQPRHQLRGRASTASRSAVEGDPARLQQIHVNLLNNAAKYTPRGGHVALDGQARWTSTR